MIDTAKRNKRQREWLDANRDRIDVRVSKGLKERVINAAGTAKISTSQWVEQAILAALGDGPDGR